MFRFAERVVMAATVIGGVACASGSKSGAAPSTAPTPHRALGQPPRNGGTPDAAKFQHPQRHRLQGPRVAQRGRCHPTSASRLATAQRSAQPGTMSRGRSGRDSNDALAVWVDENRAGGVEVLSQMAVTESQLFATTPGQKRKRGSATATAAGRFTS
jgi:hypothetical protein